MNSPDNTFTIMDYRPEHKQGWKEINEAWITDAYVMEPIDHDHCSNPEGSILAGGGQILIAVDNNGKVVGTAGLFKDDEDTYELIKMAVDKNHRGGGVGKALCQAAIERAEAIGAKLFYLYSNRAGSAKAIEIYRKLGFVEVPVDRQDFVRADIRMDMWFLENLKFPIGKYKKPATISSEDLQLWASQIETLPRRLEAAVANMTDEQLNTPYRPGGWTVRQLVHHIADSHANAHCRFRLALTEHKPVIKPYEQDDWVKLADVKMPVQPSLDMIRGLHARWHFLIKNLTDSELRRVYVHPEHGREFSVGEVVAMYAHHGDNHLEQILGLRRRMKW